MLQYSIQIMIIVGKAHNNFFPNMVVQSDGSIDYSSMFVNKVRVKEKTTLGRVSL